jgi:uncharacterized protein (DUF58 family)
VNRLLKWLTFLALAAAFVLRNPLLFLAGVLLLLLAIVTGLWDRYALAAVTYTRRISEPRLFAGEETDVTVEIVNAKPLPLSWLKVEDEWPDEVKLLRGTLHYHWKPGRRLLINIVSLRFYQRVRKRYRVQAVHRGALEFGPAEISSGDMFGFREQLQEVPQTDTLIVYPRVVPVAPFRLPAAYPFGDERAARRLADDPLRVAGVQAYASGDSLRTIHWRATARRGELQTKTFDPSAALVTALFLDLRTLPDSPGYIPEYLEYGISAAASLARYLLDARYAVGLYVNGAWRGAGALTLRLPPSRRPDHWFDILDGLARLSGLTAADIKHVLQAERPRLPFGATVLVISAVPSLALAAILLEARAAGHPVGLIAIGDTPPPQLSPEIPAFWIGGRAAYKDLTELVLDASRPT